MHSYADLVNIDAPNLDLRDDSRVKCKYFGSCAGCQYQVSFLLLSRLAAELPKVISIRDAARTEAKCGR